MADTSPSGVDSTSKSTLHTKKHEKRNMLDKSLSFLQKAGVAVLYSIIGIFKKTWLPKSAGGMSNLMRAAGGVLSFVGLVRAFKGIRDIYNHEKMGFWEKTKAIATVATLTVVSSVAVVLFNVKKSVLPFAHKHGGKIISAAVGMFAALDFYTAVKKIRGTHQARKQAGALTEAINMVRSNTNSPVSFSSVLNKDGSFNETHFSSLGNTFSGLSKDQVEYLKAALLRIKERLDKGKLNRFFTGKLVGQKDNLYAVLLAGRADLKTTFFSRMIKGTLALVSGITAVVGYLLPHVLPLKLAKSGFSKLMEASKKIVAIANISNALMSFAGEIRHKYFGWMNYLSPKFWLKKINTIDEKDMQGRGNLLEKGAPRINGTPGSVGSQSVSRGATPGAQAPVPASAPAPVIQQKRDNKGRLCAPPAPPVLSDGYNTATPLRTGIASEPAPAPAPSSAPGQG